MSYQTITLDIENRIATITLNRPKALNAINQLLMQEIGQAMDQLATAPIDGVIITGSGPKAFAAGADIKEFENLDDRQGAALSRAGHEVYNKIERFHKPVIAAVNGFALGGGCELAMACHMRVASDNARFGQPEVNLGLIPGYGGSQRLIQLVGKGQAIELLLTADMVKAERALQIGLVNHVTTPEELLPMCQSIIEKIGTKGPTAVAKTIELVNAYFDKTADGFELEIGEFGIAIGSEESTEGALAFVEKRKANFKK